MAAGMPAAGAQSVRLSAAEATLAREREAWAQERLAAAMGERETVQAYRQREQEPQAQANEAERRLEDERRTVAERDRSSRPRATICRAGAGSWWGFTPTRRSRLRT